MDAPRAKKGKKEEVAEKNGDDDKVAGNANMNLGELCVSFYFLFTNGESYQSRMRYRCRGSVAGKSDLM